MSRSRDKEARPAARRSSDGAETAQMMGWGKGGEETSEVDGAAIVGRFAELLRLWLQAPPLPWTTPRTHLAVQCSQHPPAHLLLGNGVAGLGCVLDKRVVCAACLANHPEEPSRGVGL